MRTVYPTVKIGARLGQLTEVDVDTLESLLLEVEQTVSALPDLPDVYVERLSGCQDAVSWVKVTRDLTDYMNATGCLESLLFDVQQFGETTVEDPQLPSAAQPAQTTVQREGGFIAPTLLIVAGGAAALGLVIYAAIKS